MDPELPCDVVRGRDDPAAVRVAPDDERLAPQARILELLDGGEERVQVQVRDDHASTSVASVVPRRHCCYRPDVASVDVPVALLGYGTVGSAVDRLLRDQAADIERATGHRLRVVRALVRDPAKDRDGDVATTTDFAEIRDDPEIAVVAEVMGGLEPAGDHVLELLRAGKPVVTANKQLVAARGAELFAAAAEAGVQLRFEASVCAAIPVIKVLREALVVSNVHRVLGIVNGTTNFVLTEMERGATYDEALAEAQRLGFAEADPTEDVSGKDAAAKMAILATVAFGSRVTTRGRLVRGPRAGRPGGRRAPPARWA